MGSQFVDFNADGHLDYLTATFDGSPHISYGGAKGFGTPERIKAASKFMGEDRLYPSPVLHDVNGDKMMDIVVADLFGRITVAHGAGAAPGFQQEQQLLDSRGERLKFSNW